MSSPQSLTHALFTPSGIICLVPGLALTGLVAAAAFGIRTLSGIAFLSPLMLAMVLGILIRNGVGMPELAKSGNTFAMKRLLRIAIILLGLQLTFTQIGTIGVSAVLILVTCTVLTFVFTKFAGRLLKVDPKLSELIAAGTSICGASAVIATNTVTRASEEDVAYAIACVTLFGSIAVLTYPLLAYYPLLEPRSFGLWSGASIHEIAQVVATSFQHGQASGEFGTIAKLSRILLLAPMVLMLTAIARRSPLQSTPSDQGDAPWPWFVLGFLALVLVNSIFTLPNDLKSNLSVLTTVLLTMALAAMGLSTDIRKLTAKGLRPFLLGLVSFLFIATLSLGLITLFV